MSLKTLKTESKTAAKGLLDNAVTNLKAMDSSYQALLAVGSKPSNLIKAFESSNQLEKNTVVMDAVSSAQDSIAAALSDLYTFETYLLLQVPQMEDGNNWGVQIQLAAMKGIADAKEALNKANEELPKYFSDRADAMDKLNLKTESSTSTTKKEDTDGETKTTTSNETKVTEGAASFHRIKAVYSVDVKYLLAAQKALRSTTTSYLSVVDFLTKNKEKIEKPKGSNEGRGYSSMY